MKTKNVTLRCVDMAECLVFNVTYWESDHECDYDFSIEDAYCGGSGYTGFFGRLKRAWKAFTAKPVSYSSVIGKDKETVKKWFDDCLALMESAGKDETE